MTSLPFVKMHGLGNDYVYINGFVHTVADPSALARAVSPRHTGIGSDGLILLVPDESGRGAHLRMRMFNADGSESGMCGNGLRCVARMAVEHGICRENPMRIATGDQIVEVGYRLDDDGAVGGVTVNLGPPMFEAARVPWRPDRVAELLRTIEEGPLAGHLIDHPSEIDRLIVSMGNPHLCFFVSDVASVPLEEIGPVLEHHPAFPQRVNVHVAQVISRDELRMRTWERGSGITLACGSGAAAVCVVAASTERAARRTLIHLPGGALQLHWDERSGDVLKTGPATEVFRGEWRG